MKTGRPFSVLIAATLTAGCATATNEAGPSNRNLITADDIAETNARTAQEAVTVLQPHWLGSRGPRSLTDMTPSRVTVVVNGVEVGDASYLSKLSVVDVSQIRYYEPGDAAARYGMGHERGVIEVTLKGGSSRPESAGAVGRGETAAPGAINLREEAAGASRYRQDSGPGKTPPG